MAGLKGAGQDFIHAAIFGAGAIAGAVVVTAIAKYFNINYGFQGQAYSNQAAVNAFTTYRINKDRFITRAAYEGANLAEFGGNVKLA